MQSWTQRQCSCCFRDPKNFERFNWALQILILLVVEITTHLHDVPDSTNTELGKGVPTVVSKDTSEETLGQEIETSSIKRPLWDIEDKDKLIHLVAKVYLNTFPTYVAYKQHMQMKNEEITPQEIHGLSQFCEINEPEASPYLFRNVTLFCKIGGMSALAACISGQTP